MPIGLSLRRDHELADFLGLEKSTMSGLVERAERRGLLRRAPNAEDGRIVEVFSSAKGRELAARLYVQIEQSLMAMTNLLDAADRERLRRLLVRMLGARDGEQ